jgi:hypothetical protein
MAKYMPLPIPAPALFITLDLASDIPERYSNHFTDSAVLAGRGRLRRIAVGPFCGFVVGVVGEER